jgi:hypothetical protein
MCAVAAEVLQEHHRHASGGVAEAAVCVADAVGRLGTQEFCLDEATCRGHIVPPVNAEIARPRVAAGFDPGMPPSLSRSGHAAHDLIKWLAASGLAVAGWPG